MQQRPSEQLDKVLALADSSHDAEAAAAVRKARQMLSRDGLNFSDLARAASTSVSIKRPSFNMTLSSIFSGPQAQLEAQLIRMRQKLDDLQVDLQAKDVQLEFWRRRAEELEQNFNLSQSETQRWRQLARDTVEKLWDLGAEVRSDTADIAPEARSKIA